MKKILSYSKVYPFSEEHASIRSNGKHGFLNKNGEICIPCKYHHAEKFSEGLAAVKKNGKWGFIDTSNTIQIPLIYDMAGCFSEGLAAVKKDEKWGFIDQYGNEQIPFVYETIKAFNEGVAAVFLEGKYGYIDKEGKTEIPHLYDSANSFHSGIASVEIEEKSGYINRDGTLVTPLKYEGYMCYDCKAGVFALQEDGQEIWTLYDKNGTARELLEYVFVDGFHEKFAVVCDQNEKYGCINACGKETIPCKYELLSRFSEGLIAAQMDGYWGFVDNNDKTMIPFEYTEVGDFSNGMAHVKKGKREAYFIDKNNNKVIPLKKELPLLKITLLITAIVAVIVMLILK